MAKMTAVSAAHAENTKTAATASSPLAKVETDLASGLTALGASFNPTQLITSLETGFAAGGLNGALTQVETDSALILTNPSQAALLHGAIYIYMLAAPFIPFLAVKPKPV